MKGQRLIQAHTWTIPELVSGTRPSEGLVPETIPECSFQEFKAKKRLSEAH